MPAAAGAAPTAPTGTTATVVEECPSGAALDALKGLLVVHRAVRIWIGWAVSFLAGLLAAGLLAADLRTGSLYDALAECCGIRVTGGSE